MPSVAELTPETGLVPCPKTRTNRFPAAEAVGMAAAGVAAASAADPVGGLVGQALADAGYGEGPRWFLVVTPGSVQLTSADLAKGQRRAVRAQTRHERDVNEAASTAVSEWFRNMLVEGGLLEAADDQAGEAQPGRVISEWSYKSRLNMTRRLSTLDYNGLAQQGEIAMLTLTYPGEWLSVVPDGRAFKRHVDLFRQRYRKKYGRGLAGVWKMEFQRRGAPHLHMLTALPCELREFRSWARSAWASIVNHPDVIQRMKHEAAGVNVDRPDRPMTDPKRIGVYFNKHGLWGSKEYQNRPPQEWIDAAAEGKSVGRFWGYWKLQPVAVPALVTGDEAVAIARMLRRWHGRYAVTRTVQRVDTRTGLVRYRTVRRSAVRMPGTAGFLTVNDGPSVAFMIERLLLSRR